MNEKLIVKNFGPIKDAELDLKKVTVFIGPQGSGKSTLAKLVAVCKEEEKPLLASKQDDFLDKIRKYSIESFRNKDTFFEYFSKISNGKYQIVLNSIPWEWIYVNSPTELSVNIDNEISKIKDRVGNIETVEEALLISSVKAFRKLLYDYNIKEPIYIPTERFLISTISASLFGLMNNNINLPKTLTEFGNRYITSVTSEQEEVIQNMRTGPMKMQINKVKDIKLFDLQLHHMNGQDTLFDKKNNYQIDLRDSASGMQSSIPLILVIDHESISGNKHFIIEEPELNLFPTTQKQLVGYLADKCTQNGNELLMTTHSPYVLTALNNLIFAYQVAQVLPERADEIAQIIPREQWLNPDDVAAYYVGEDENGEKGGIHSIFNRKTGLIGQNELDETSEELGDEFDALMNIYRTRKRETVN